LRNEFKFPFWRVFSITLIVLYSHFAHSKVKVVLEEREELAYLEKYPSCEIGDKTFTADEDTIEYEGGIYDDKTGFTSTSKSPPSFKMYDNEKLKGKIASPW